MRTTHPITPDVAVPGMALSGYESRPGLLPLRAQQIELVIAASEAGTLTFTMQDQEFRIARSVEVTISGVDEAVSLDEILAAFEADPYFNAFATYAEDGTDTLTLTARVAGRSYTLNEDTSDAGSMTAVATESVSAIDEKGSGIEFGRFLKQGAGDDEDVDTLESGDAVGDLVGVIRRTEGNHFRHLQETLSDVDDTLRGTTYPIMEKGRIWVEVEAAVTPASTPYVRIAGSGEIGALTPTPDGGNTIDASSICKFVKTSVVLSDGTLVALLKLNIVP